MAFRVRHYDDADFDEYVRLHREAGSAEGSGYHTSPQALAGRLRHPGRCPERNVFVAEAGDGRLAGCVEVRPELQVGRAVIGYLIRPEHQVSDAAVQLVHAALSRASELGASVAHVNVPEEDALARDLLSGAGFVPVRRFLELELPLSTIPMETANQAAYRRRHFMPGDEEALAELQNRCFAGTWGFNPNTTEEIAHVVNSVSCLPEGVILIFDEDKPIAYCWTTMDPDDDARAETSRGRIHMMGTDPDHRGRGIGRAALLAGLGHLQARGAAVAELTVDSENEKARSLYESAGFKKRTTSVWYEKALA